MSDRNRDRRDDDIHRFTGSGDPNRPNQEFTYKHPMRLPTETDSYRPSNYQQDDDKGRPRYSKGQRGGGRQKSKPPPHPKWTPVPAHERPILSFNVREKTPDLLPGMMTGGEFLPLLDESGGNTGGKIDNAPASEDGVEMEMSDDGKPELAITKVDGIVAEEAVDGEKTDVISMIRAFKSKAPVSKPRNPVTDNDDFISLSFGDEPTHSNLDGDNDGGSHKRRKVNDQDVRNEASFSHRQNHFGPPKDTGPPGAPYRPATSGRPSPPPGLSGKRPGQQPNGGDPSSHPNPIPTVPVYTRPETAANSKLLKKGNGHYIDIPKNRKRSYADMNRKQPTLDGNIIRDYIATPKCDPYPWTKIGSDHSRTCSMPAWLHNEILDFITYIEPRAYEHAVRRELIHRIRDIVTKLWTDTDLRVFGSFAAELYLPTSDIDLVVISTSFAKTGYPRYSEKNSIQRLKQAIQYSGIAKLGSLTMIANAKVPIIKFIDSDTNLHVDISFENSSGLVANETFIRWKTEFPAMPALLTIIKQFLAMRGLNEVYLGGLGSFSVTCLIVSMLQLLPSVASGKLDPRQHLGVMLLEFFELYGKNFSTDITGVCVDSRHPCYFRKNEVFPIIQRGPAPPQTNLLCIQDPNNPENDISRSSFHIRLILHLWAEAHDDIVSQMRKFEKLVFADRENRSLLGVILGGNYQKIEDQRALMRKVYIKRIGSLEDILKEEQGPGIAAGLSRHQDIARGSSHSTVLGSSPISAPSKKRSGDFSSSRGSNPGGRSGPVTTQSGLQGNGRPDKPFIID